MSARSRAAGGEAFGYAITGLADAGNDGHVLTYYHADQAVTFAALPEVGETVTGLTMDLEEDGGGNGRISGVVVRGSVIDLGEGAVQYTVTLSEANSTANFDGASASIIGTLPPPFGDGPDAVVGAAIVQDGATFHHCTVQIDGSDFIITAPQAWTAGGVVLSGCVFTFTKF